MGPFFCGTACALVTRHWGGDAVSSKAQLLFNHLASQELAPQKLWTRCAGAGLLRDWMLLVGRYLPQDRIEMWRLPGREPRAAFSPFHVFSLLQIFKAFFGNHQIFNYTMLFLCVKNNFEEFSYFQENYGVFTSDLLGLFLCSALISVGNCVASTTELPILLWS